MAKPARELDDVSAQLAEMMRHADALLDDWMRFGTEVRARVEREAATIGTAVAAGVDAASERALAQRLSAVHAELERLEGRMRSAARTANDQRTVERRMLAGIAVGVGVVIVLLGVLVMRSPERPQIVTPPAPVHESVPVDAAPPPPPILDAAAPAGDASVAPVDPARHASPGAAPVKRK